MPDIIPHNENLLVSQLAEGNEAAFTTLYLYYSPRIYKNVLRIVHDQDIAEEIVQELFTRLWQSRHNSGLQENFTGYLYRIAQNLVIDFFRKIKKDRLLLEKFKKLVEVNYEHVEEALAFQQTSYIFEKALNQLTPQQKKVYKLIKIEGYSYKRTAEILGISPNTVKEYLVATNKCIRNFILNNSEVCLMLLIFNDAGLF